MSQAIKVFLRAAGTKGTVVDELNAGSANTPSFAIFTDTEIRLKLYRDASTAYTAAELNGYAWEFWADGDWDASTSPKIGTTTGITVDTDGTIVIPIATGNQELVTWLGTADSKEMKAELLGYDGVSAQYADFCVQFQLKVTNRVFYTGSYEPSPIEGLYYTKAQSDGRFAPISVVARVTSLEQEVNGVNGALDSLLG